jgi:hypothetical protein
MENLVVRIADTASSSLALMPSLVKFRQSSFHCVPRVQIKALQAWLLRKVELTNSRTGVRRIG